MIVDSDDDRIRAKSASETRLVCTFALLLLTARREWFLPDNGIEVDGAKVCVQRRKIQAALATL